jgi:hypothetical protein
VLPVRVSQAERVDALVSFAEIGVQFVTRPTAGVQNRLNMDGPGTKGGSSRRAEANRRSWQ